MSRPDPRNVCDGCRQSLDRRLRSHVELGPIVRSHIWQQIADPGERLLCFACMYWRSVERRGQMLRFADLRPCGWNLSNRPYSWFDRFMEKEGPPQNLAEWRAALAEWRATK